MSDLGAKLFRSVLGSPDDDGPRLVYADYLQEKGDPRGEFIGLQIERIRGRGTPEMLAREHALLEKNLDRWLGKIGPAVVRFPADAAWAAGRGIVFERGFLHACEVGVSSDKTAREVMGREEWATVHTLDVSTFTLPTYVVFVTHPVMTSLRSVAGVGVGVFRVKRELPFESVACTGGARADSLDGENLRDLIRSRNLPRLKSLRFGSCSFMVENVEPLWTSPLGLALEELEIKFVMSGADGFLRSAADSKGALRRFSIGSQGDWQYDLLRDEAGRLSRLTVSLRQDAALRNASLAWVRQVLEGIAPDMLTSLAIHTRRLATPDEGFEKRMRARFPALQLQLD